MGEHTKTKETPLHIVVALTCHNRREKTLACLRRLPHNGGRVEGETTFTLDVVLVDDNSTDGTAAAVRDEFPNVTLLEGDGSLYWNGGMRYAISHAMEKDPDYLLMLNDDTMLFDDAIERLVSDHRQVKKRRGCPVVMVGSTHDPETEELTYGGWRRARSVNPLRTEFVTPSDEPKPCDTFNANCALIDREVINRVGNLDAAYTHGFGDYDYGFRVQNQGGEIWVGAGVHGECPRDQGPRPWFDAQASWWERITALRDVKAEPLGERRIYARRHGGALWILAWLSPYIRVTLAYLVPGAFLPSGGPGERTPIRSRF